MIQQDLRGAGRAHRRRGHRPPAEAFRARGGRAGDPTFEVAVAKVRTGEAAGHRRRASRTSRTARSASPTSTALHFVTRRLWSWRAEFGAEAHWASGLGREVAARGADNLWSHLTAR